ncbi:hypothetical protein [Azospirillum sp. B2RO_4]|uniref:hypothetical protein n=1 Tax=Azospirillum sp. B2RO_4 TaxID=3027796 RepID=UPI003DA9D2CB
MSRAHLGEAGLQAVGMDPDADCIVLYFANSGDAAKRAALVAIIEAEARPYAVRVETIGQARLS